jgi:hypothetical protein
MASRKAGISPNVSPREIAVTLESAVLDCQSPRPARGNDLIAGFDIDATRVREL